MRYRKWIYLLGAIVVAVAVWVYVSSDSTRQAEPAAASGDAAAPIVVVTLPASLSNEGEAGKALFEENCVACHGPNAAGLTGLGPPLVHKIYEPSHHGDPAFLLAASRGVRSHHWDFGDMPPVEGVTPEEVVAIVAYVRELQRANGIN